MIKELLEAQGYMHVLCEDDFKKMYPPTKRYEYRPQPNVRPASYPCMVCEEEIIDNPYGACW